MTSAPIFAANFGAVPDGKSINTKAFQSAIDACGKGGGGKVVVAPGTYLAGGLILRDHVEFHLEEGAILRASEDLSDYPRRENDLTPVALLYADKCRGVSLTGKGCLDGNGPAFWSARPELPQWVQDKKAYHIWVPAFNYVPKPRPRALILFCECRDVRIEDVRIRDSMHWTLLLMSCDDVVIRGITMNTLLHGPNTDGIDLDSCRDVVVENCDILTGDDAVCLKSKNIWGLKRTSRNITVRNCTLRSPTHGFTIGTETQADFENIVFTDSRIMRAGKYRTNSAIDLSILDGGAIRGVKVENIEVTDAVVPIQVRLGNVGRGQKMKRPGAIENVVMKNVTATGALGVNLITGLPGRPVRDISLRQVTITAEGGVDSAKILHPVPEIPEEYPPGPAWIYLPAHGFYCRHVVGLELADVTVRTIQPDPRPSFVYEDVTDLRSLHLHVRYFPPGAPFASAVSSEA